MIRLRKRVGLIIAGVLCSVPLLVTVGTVIYVATSNQSVADRAPIPILDAEHPCGPVSLAVVASLLGSPTGLAEAKELVACDPRGRSSMAELIAGLHSAGISAVGVQLDPESLSQLTTPLILFVRDSHFEVAVPTATEKVIIVDPPKIPAATTLAELSIEWRGDAILVARGEEDLGKLLDRLRVTRR